VGAGGGRRAGRRPWELARALDRGLSEAATNAGPAPQSAAAPSPFPPIADYAFLSNCHTGALVAADGAIDWLCVPAFDSPSVFGSLLDREAGFFRLAPFGINHPSSRAYETGTNVLLTTWKTPGGWIVVRDALTMGRGGVVILGGIVELVPGIAAEGKSLETVTTPLISTAETSPIAESAPSPA
jgi:hypothetical protein